MPKMLPKRLMLAIMIAVTMVLVTAQSAFAVTGTVNVESTVSSSFDAYQLFKADVTDEDDGKVARNLQYASIEAMRAVTDTIIENGGADDNAITAQKASEWLTSHINASDTANGIVMSIAQSMVDSDADRMLVKPSTDTELEEGYWLIVSHHTDKRITTSPILILVGGDKASATEKAGVPSIDKEILQKDGTETKHAEAPLMTRVTFKVDGTVASDIDEYDEYFYRIIDDMSDGLTPTLGSIKVAIDGTEIPSDKYEEAFSNQRLTITFNDIKDAFPDINGNSHVVMTYDAMLDVDKNVIYGSSGNANVVSLEFSNNPSTDGHGTSEKTKARLYTYRLHIDKDGSDGKALSGASFTVKSSDGMFVQNNGSLGETSHEFVTDENGDIDVMGLTSGTYTVTETKAPDGYTTVNPFDIIISSDYDASGALVSLDAKADGNGVAIDGVNAENGTIDATVTDDMTPPSVPPSVNQTGDTNIPLILVLIGMVTGTAYVIRRLRDR